MYQSFYYSTLYKLQDDVNKKKEALKEPNKNTDSVKNDN